MILAHHNQMEPNPGQADFAGWRQLSEKCRKMYMKLGLSKVQHLFQCIRSSVGLFGHMCPLVPAIGKN